MARERYPAVRVMGCPIVREPDGLAMSSRNAYLSPEQRTAALALSRGLKAAADAWSRGTRDPVRLRARVEDVVNKAVLVASEYISVADPVTLAELRLPANRALISVAARVGKARLIDNSLLGMDVSDLS
jgi:pantoate--beta-alanine ligase